MPRIIYKSKNAVVIVKPVGMPSQSDPTGDKDAMTATSEKLALMGEPDALWLVHRLDRTVGGVMAFARTKTAAAILTRAITEGKFEKEYFAVIEGRGEGGTLRDYIYKDALKSRAIITKDAEKRSAKLAELEYTPLATFTTEKGERTLVQVKLITGRFHQIRVQFSQRGLPLVGDGKYGSTDKGSRTPALFSHSLSTAEICGGKKITATPPLNEYPWSLFEEEKYNL